MKRSFLFLIFFSLFLTKTYSQGCCSGGGNNPLTGSAPAGVLDEGMLDIALSNVNSFTNRFFTGDVLTDPYFKDLKSNYLFLRTDYGLAKKLTFSAMTGYYTHRRITEFETGNENNKIESKGIGDLILLPRYQIYRKKKEKTTTEFDLGMGMKIPLGIENDSTFVGYSYFLNTSGSTPFIDSNEIWQTSPPLVQATTGSNDFLASAFFMNTFNASKIDFFVSALYTRRGWNSLGIKFGDQISVGLFVGKTVLKGLYTLIQVRGEWTGMMKTHSGMDYLATYNIDVNSTGLKSIFCSPQVSYSFPNKIRIFVFTDIPVYQYVNGTQAAIPYNFTLGLNYRFSTTKNKVCEPETSEKKAE